MPPNRKPSTCLSDPRAAPRPRPAAVVFVAAAKDYRPSGRPGSPSRPIVDESYWHWPAPAETSGHGDDDDNDDDEIRRGLFTADRIVAHLVRGRGASRRQEGEDEKEADDEEETGEAAKGKDGRTTIPVTTTAIAAAERRRRRGRHGADDDDDDERRYWDWTNAGPTSHRPIDDPRPSGTIVAVGRDDPVRRNQPQRQPAPHRHQTAATVDTVHDKTTHRENDHGDNCHRPHQPDHDDDIYWGWETFPRHAMERRFSHTRYERYLLFPRERSHDQTATTTTTTTSAVAAIGVDHRSDEYWQGL